MNPIHIFIIIGSAFLVSCAAHKLPRNAFMGETFPISAIPEKSTPPPLDTPRSFKHVDPEPGPKLNIFRCGLYQGTEMSLDRYASPNTTTGYTGRVAGRGFVRAADIIPAQINTYFGFQMAVAGISFQEVVPITIRLLHPPTTHPVTGKTTSVEEWVIPMMFETKTCALWGFHYTWEAVPGKWAMQALHQDKVLAEKVFTVVKP